MSGVADHSPESELNKTKIRDKKELKELVEFQANFKVCHQSFLPIYVFLD